MEKHGKNVAKMLAPKISPQLRFGPAMAMAMALRSRLQVQQQTSQGEAALHVAPPGGFAAEGLCTTQVLGAESHSLVKPHFKDLHI